MKVRLFLSGLVCVAALAQDVRVTASNKVISGGGRVSWGSQNNLLAYDKLSANGYYDVYTANPDGSAASCLTCSATQFPYSKGNPEWHPSNQFLALQIQWQSSFIGDSLSTPGAGVNNDLYITDAAGRNYWAVTQGAKGVLHPRFSHSGKQLLWVQRTFANNWNLMLADFAIVDNAPQISNLQSLPPCQENVFCETGGFSEDDSTVYFTHSAASGDGTAFDIYSYNLQTQTTLNLTNSTDQWNEFPTALPGGGARIVWMSGKFSLGGGLQTDYWMMNEDGTNKTRLTYYNFSGAPSWFLGPVSTAKYSWSPDGKSLAAYLIPGGFSNGQTGDLYVLNLEPAAPTLSAASFARPPLAPDSIASTFSSNLADDTASATSTSLPVALAGCSATLTDARGQTYAVPLFFASPNQVNWLVPSGPASGPATVQFTNASGASVRATVDIESSAPALFTADASGTGSPAAYVLTYSAGSATPYSDQPVYACANSTCVAAPISLGSPTDAAYLILYATGLRHASVISATIGGMLLPISYIGAQGEYPGLDQVNILLPRSLAGMDQTTLQLTADGAASNTVSLLFP